MLWPNGLKWWKKQFFWDGPHLPGGVTVTRFGKIWQKFTRIWQIFDSLFFIWQNTKPTLENLGYYWANFRCWNGPILKNNLIIWSHWVVVLLTFHLPVSGCPSVFLEKMFFSHLRRRRLNLREMPNSFSLTSWDKTCHFQRGFKIWKIWKYQKSFLLIFR